MLGASPFPFTIIHAMDDGSGVATSPDDFIFGTSDMAETPICDMSAQF